MGAHRNEDVSPRSGRHNPRAQGETFERFMPPAFAGSYLIPMSQPTAGVMGYCYRRPLCGLVDLGPWVEIGERHWLNYPLVHFHLQRRIKIHDLLCENADTIGFSRMVLQFHPGEQERFLDTADFSRVVLQFRPSSTVS